MNAPFPVAAGSAVVGAPLLALDGVSKTYVTPGAVRIEALRAVSLEIRAGEFVAIMGQSGSGKSTLMNILGCLDRCSEGRYLVTGQDTALLGSSAMAALRRNIFGFVFQAYNLIPSASAIENVELPAIYAGSAAKRRHARARHLLERMGLADRLGHLPSQMSGGQQQRTAIARAMMNSGRVLLADEPTGALDSANGVALMEILRELSESGHTVIVVTHEAAVASHASRVIELHDGQVVSDRVTGPVKGRPPELTIEANRGAFSRLARFSDAVTMAARALRCNILRTVLTLLGITIGVASVIAMLAVGEGSKQRVLQRISALGDNLVNVLPGAPNQRFGEGGSVKSLTIDDARAIADLPNVGASIATMFGMYTVRVGRYDLRTQVTATGFEFPQVRKWDAERGSFFTQDDQLHYRAVAVLGSAVVRALFPGGDDPLGAVVLIQNVPFEVLGVMPAHGAAMGGVMDQDNAVYIPVTTGQLRLFGQRYVQSVTAAVTDTAHLAATEATIRSLLLSRHKTEDFQVRNFSTIIQTFSSAQDSMKLLLAVVASISLLVGGIGVMNVMLMSVAERTREIGIRMASGASARDIRDQFMTEAFVISAVGGLLGIVCGLATIAVLDFRLVPVVYQAWPVAAAFACALAAGLVFGIAPAMKASRLDPVVALARD